MFKRLLITSLVTLFSACGGGGDNDFQPIVTQIQAQSLRYGQSATIKVAGNYLRSDMVVDAGFCTNPTFSPISSPDLATLNCQVTATGALPITIRSANGAVLRSETLTVLPPQVTMLTSKGTIVMELNAAMVPATVNNFLDYVRSGFYQSTLFHRVIPGFVIQGGGYTKGMVKKEGQKAPIALESNKGLLNTRGTLAMARTSLPDSATSEFFINLVNNSSLNYQDAESPGYAVFGQVIQGMDVVDAIAAEPTITVNSAANVPATDVTISLAFQTQ
jgi:cyclophilin family peptidyl-prolyl cis-trans isomerase